MQLPRRTFLHFAAGAAALPAVSQVAWAQAYPSKPVRIVVGFPPGVATDIVARLMAQALSERLGQEFIVDNRPGAGSNIGAQVVVHAPPDGYTLLAMTVTNAVNASLYTNLDFDFVRDITPVAGTIRSANVLVVNPSVPAKTIPEFIAYAKANPGKVNYASAGYRHRAQHGGRAVQDDDGRQPRSRAVQDELRARSARRAGAVRVHADTADRSASSEAASCARSRSPARRRRMRCRASRTIAQFVPGYEANIWHGIAAPKNTPAAIVDKLNKATNDALADAAVKAKLANLGAEPMPMSPAEFGKFITEQVDKWAKVVKFAEMKPPE